MIYGDKVTITFRDSGKLNGLYSYAHEDDQWRDELDKHLSALQDQG